MGTKEKKEAKNQFTSVPTDVIYNTEISNGAKLILLHIYAKNMNNYEIYKKSLYFNADKAEIEEMSNSFGKCTKSIKNYIAELKKKEYIISNEKKNSYLLNTKKLPMLPTLPQMDKLPLDKLPRVAIAATKIAEVVETPEKTEKGIENTVDNTAEDIAIPNNQPARENTGPFLDEQWKERDYKFFADKCPNTEVTDEMYRNVLTNAKKVYDKCQMKYREMLNGDVNCIYCAVDSEEYKKDCAVNYLIFLDNRGYLTYECFIRDGVKYVGFSNLKDSNDVSPKEQEKQVTNENPINEDNNVISLNWNEINRQEMQLIQDRKTIDLLWRIRKEYKKNDRQPLEYGTYIKKNKITMKENEMMTVLKNMELLKLWKNDADGKFYFKPIYTRYMQQLTNKNN